MLQRGAKRIVWLVNTDTGISLEADFCNAKEVLWKKEDYLGKGAHADIGKSLVTNQMTDKFGYGTTSAGGILSNNQVFAKEEFNPILCTLQTRKHEGKPLIWSSEKMKVQDNRYWQIDGYPKTKYDIELVFIYHEQCDDFFDLLPEETKRVVNGRLPPFENY